jgi:hypothetical protein
LGGILTSKTATTDQQVYCHRFGQNIIPEDGRRITVEVCVVGSHIGISREDGAKIRDQCEKTVGHHAFLQAVDWLRKLLPSTTALPHRRLQSIDRPADGWWPGGNPPYGGYGHQSTDKDDSKSDRIEKNDSSVSVNHHIALALGIGLGIGLGLPVMAAVAILICWCVCHHQSVSGEDPQSITAQSTPETVIFGPNLIAIGNNELETIKEESEVASATTSFQTYSQITTEMNGRVFSFKESTGEMQAPAETETIVTTEESGSKEEYQQLP